MILFKDLYLMFRILLRYIIFNYVCNNIFFNMSDIYCEFGDNIFSNMFLAKIKYIHEKFYVSYDIYILEYLLALIFNIYDIKVRRSIKINLTAKRYLLKRIKTILYIAVVL